MPAKSTPPPSDLIHYGSFENLLSGMGSVFSGGSAWVPQRRKINKTQLRRYLTVYETTIAKSIVCLPVEGLMAATPVTEGSYDLSTYRAVSTISHDLLIMARLFGYAWVDSTWGVHSLFNEYPTEPPAIEAFGPKVLDSLEASDLASKYSSVLSQPYDDIRLYEATKAAMLDTVGKFATRWMGVPEMIKSSKDCAFVESMDRIAQVQSATGVLTLDATASFGIAHYDYEELERVFNMARQAISAASGIPQAILFQESPSGSTSGRFEMSRWLETLWSLTPQFLEVQNALLASIHANFKVTDLDFAPVKELYGIGISTI